MLKGLKRLAGGGLLLLEIRGLRVEVARLASAAERFAAAFELQNLHAYPPPPIRVEGEAVVEVTYINDQVAAEFMDIELRLTQARGVAPTEDEILVEFELRRQGQTGAVS